MKLSSPKLKTGQSNDLQSTSQITQNRRHIDLFLQPRIVEGQRSLRSLHPRRVRHTKQVVG